MTTSTAAAPKAPPAAKPAHTPPARPATATEKLAIYGGPRAVTAKYREKWKNTRLRDLAPMVRHLVRGRNTQVRGAMLFGLENRFAALTGTRYAVMTNSGTAALHSAYFAVGIRPGDEVIVPTYTFFATAAPVMQCGATPVFCDVDERTLTADPDDALRRITSKTRAICVVHVWGNPAAMDRFVDVAGRHGVALIEDASHAHGATYQGRPVGSWGDVGCFSLQGSKAVSGGEAGIAVTNNPDYYDRMLALGHNGRAEDHVTGRYPLGIMNLGLKYRPHMAAIALASGGLSRLAELNRLRRRNYQMLADELAGCEAVRPIETYPEAERGGLLEFILRFRPEFAGGWSREAFVAACRAEGVQVAPDRYTCVDDRGRLLHKAPLFNELPHLDWGGALSQVHFEKPPRQTHLPVAEKLADELLTLPPFTKVSDQYIRQTAQALRKVAKVASVIQDLRADR